MKVLVVDDDQAVRAFLCDALETIGHHVIGVAEDGMEALSLYEKNRPDLVFMDIDMPIMDGFDIIDVVRRIDPNAKIVVITGTERVRGSSFSRRHASKPSTSGIITSSRIRSGRARCAIEMASLALLAARRR